MTLTILILFLLFFQLQVKSSPSKRYTLLTSRIEDLIKKYPKIYCGVYVKTNWLNGEIDINGKNQFPAASLIKLPIAIIALQDLEKGKIKLDDILTIKEKHIAEGAGLLKRKKPGHTVTLKNAFEIMLTISDNIAFNLMVDRLGGIAYCNRRLKELGLDNTLLINYIGDFSGRTKISPYDLVSCLEKAYSGELLSKESIKYLDETLLKVKNNFLIKQGIGRKTKFAHKTGTIGIATGDAGIIYLGFGKKIYIAIIVEREFDDFNGVKLIREIARIVYKDLS